MMTEVTSGTPATSAEVRDELIDLLQRDLMGPWGELDETISGTPRGRYLVGVLAPLSIGDDDQVTTRVRERPFTGNVESPEDFRDSEGAAVVDPDASRDVQGVLEEPDETIADSGGTDTDEDR